MRWLAARLEWNDASPDADIVAFAVYHDEAVALDRSTALERGLIAVANLFATKTARGSNEVVLAHELLHTLGATDKYDPATNMPLFPTVSPRRIRRPSTRKPTRRSWPDEFR